MIVSFAKKDTKSIWEGERITADTALRLSLYFGNSAKFWLGLQDDFDLETENQINEESFKQIRLFRKENTQLPDNEMKAS